MKNRDGTSVNPKTILLLLLCGLGVFVKAQTVWNKTYIEDRPTMLFGSVIEDSGSYTLTGVTSGYPGNIAKGIICNIDTAGVMTKYKAFIDSTNTQYGVFWNTLIKTSQEKFAFTGYAYDSLSSLLFGIADRNIDSVSVFKYYTPNTVAFQGRALLQYDDSRYYITGVHTDSFPSNGNVLLMKIDSSGNRIWEKYFNQQFLDYGMSIIKLANGNLMLGCVANDLNQTNEHAHTWLFEVDTAGTLVRQWFDSNDSTYVAEGLLQTQDGGFIYGAQKKFSESGGLVAWTNTIVKMDSSFNKQWTYKGGYRSIYTGISDIAELSDGSFLACGQYAIYGVDTALWGCVIKLDVNGNVLWERTYRGISASQTLNFLTDIDVLPDGSLIAVGQCQQSGLTPPQVGWFLKLDSNGCEIENCLTGISPFSIQHSELSIYPNPATSSFSLNIENPLLQGGSLDLYNIDGKKLCSTANNFNRQTRVDISQLPNGIYLWRYTAPNQVVQSGKVVKE